MGDPTRYDPFGDPDDMFTVADAAYSRVKAGGFEEDWSDDHWYEEETELQEGFDAGDDE